MAKMTFDPARISAIAEKLHTACGAIGPNTRDIADAQELVKSKSGELNGIGGTRLSVAISVAAMSASEDWTQGELVQACAKAAKRGNSNDSTSKTINVFISEMKTFAHPKVRDVFPTIAGACQDAWLAEQEYLAGLEGDEKKNADTPVRKFKSRIYHLTIEMARRVKDGEATIETMEDVVEWARAHDPDHDEEKVAKRMAAIIADLGGIFGDFGFEPINTAMEYLRSVTAKELLASRAAKLAEADDMVAGSLAELPQVVVDRIAASQAAAIAAGAAANANPDVTNVVEPDASPTSNPMAEGASDALDDLMNDIALVHASTSAHAYLNLAI